MRTPLQVSEKQVKARGEAGNILKLAVPIGLESVFQMGFNAIDQIIVGLLGADAVAAVGLSNSIASIALLLYASAGVGAGVMVARAFGRKEMAEVSQIASVGQTLSGLLGVLTAVFFVTCSKPILQAIGADSKLAGSANSYFQLYSISIAPMILSAVTSAVFRSLNAPKTPLIITGLAVAANTLLGFVLVLGFGPVPSLGVAGAGWATLFSQSVRCLALILFLYAGKKGVRWIWPFPGSKTGRTAVRLLGLTGPIALSEVLWGMSTFVYTVVSTRIGTATLAASQIVLSLEKHLYCDVCRFSACSCRRNRTSTWQAIIAEGQSGCLAHHPLRSNDGRRAWSTVWELLSSPSVALSEGRNRCITFCFLGSFHYGGESAGEGLEQRFGKRRFGQRRRYSLCSFGQSSWYLCHRPANRHWSGPFHRLRLFRSFHREDSGRMR